MLSILLLLPLAGALLLLVLPKERPALYRAVALVTTIVTFAVSIPLYFTGQSAGFQGMFVQEHMLWVPAWGIRYDLAMDGISLTLALLTTFLAPIAVLGAWESVSQRSREFWFHVLVLQTAMLGAFFAANLLLFFVFWELMLVPMFFLIGIWGGAQRRMATIKFFIFTSVGSLLMLVAIAYIAWAQHATQGVATLAFSDILNLRFSSGEQLLLFGAFALAFAIKVPMWPVYTWLPDAHTEAPTTGSVILAGVLLKMGTYGFARLALPLFPDAVHVVAPLFVVLAVVGIVYGALVAMVQPDIKRLIAYSSVSHLGVCMLGLFAFNAAGVQGALLQGLNHGISTGALFLLVGMIYDRTHTRQIADYGGLAKIMPVFATLFLIITMSSIGLPGTNGFVGEFLVLFGAFQHAYGVWQAQGTLAPVLWVVLAGSGMIWGAVYMLWMVQRVFFGPLNPKLTGAHAVRDLSLREVGLIVPLLVVVFWVGFFPKTFLMPMEQPVQVLLDRLEAASGLSAR